MPCNLDSTEYARSFRTKSNPALNGSGLAGTGKKKRYIRGKVRTSSLVYRNTFGTPTRKTPSRFRRINFEANLLTPVAGLNLLR